MKAALESPGRKLASFAIQFVFIILVLGTWTCVAEFRLVSPLALPTPSSVWRAFAALLSSGEYWPDLLTTVYEVIAALFAASLSGLLLGYAISRSRATMRIFEPLLSSLNSIPAVMFLPLLVLLFGLGVSSKIMMGALTGFFPVILNTIAGFADVDRIHLRAARSMGASGGQMFWRVLLPSALPVILTGLRMGAIVAVLSILGAEALGSYAGLGHRIVDSAESLAMPRMYAYIAMAILLSASVNLALNWVERRAGGG